MFTPGVIFNHNGPQRHARTMFLTMLYKYDDDKDDDDVASGENSLLFYLVSKLKYDCAV